MAAWPAGMVWQADSMAEPAACEEQQAGSAAVLPAGKVRQAGVTSADEVAAFPGEHSASVWAVPGPFDPRPMGLLSVFQCRVDFLKVPVVPRLLEPQGEVGFNW